MCYQWTSLLLRLHLRDSSPGVSQSLALRCLLIDRIYLALNTSLQNYLALNQIFFIGFSSHAMWYA